MASVWDGVSHRQKLKGDIDKAVMSDDGVKKAYNKLKSFINGPGHEDLKSVAYQSTEITEDLTSKAKEYANSKIDKKFQEAIDNAKTKLDEIKAKHGKVDDTAEKIAKEGLEKAEKALKEAADGLASKVKTGGVNKYLAAGIGAVALAGSALLLRPKAKETQA